MSESKDFMVYIGFTLRELKIIKGVFDVYSEKILLKLKNEMTPNNFLLIIDPLTVEIDKIVENFEKIREKLESVL